MILSWTYNVKCRATNLTPGTDQATETFTQVRARRLDCLASFGLSPSSKDEAAVFTNTFNWRTWRSLKPSIQLTVSILNKIFLLKTIG